MRGRLVLVAVLLALVVPVACTTMGQPSCYDNPRNMGCMSASELAAALEGK
jgi:hypothetical protein